MSIKSDCGVGGARPGSSVLRCEVTNTKRSWSSESQLEQTASHKPFKALSLNTLLKVSFLSQNNKK